MDNLTHGLTGYCIYKLMARSEPDNLRTERGLLWPTILASELSDIDMISLAFGTEANLIWHRAYTHSVVWVVIMALLLTGLISRFRPNLPRGRLFLFSLLGGLIHIVLDVLTSYGTKILLPWYDIPFALDVLPIVDAFLLAVLVIFLWLGHKNKSKAILWALVLLMGCYIGIRGYVHGNLLKDLQAQFPVGKHFDVTPVIGSIEKWRFNVTLPEGVICGCIYSFAGKTVEDTFIPDVSSQPPVRAVQNSRTVTVLKKFSRSVVYRADRLEDGWHVMIFDPRYAIPGRTLFVGHVWLDNRLNVYREKFISH